MAQGVKVGMVDRVVDWGSRRMRTKTGYALVFALLFAAAMVPVLVTCLLAGKSLIWSVDGLWEQYAWFVYAGTWLRDAVTSLLATGTFEPIMWEMDSGYGVDTVQSLVGTFLSPLFFVSVLVPARFAEFALEFMMLAMLYAAGLVFSLWRLSRGDRPALVLAGALSYVLAGNVCVMFTQPSFLTMMVAFPLVLWGADKVFEHGSPVLFGAVLTWLFAYSYYDAYMVCILLVLYCLQHWWFRIRPAGHALRSLARWVGTFVGYVLLALLVSCAFMLPQVMALVGMDRLDLEREGGLLYSVSWYLNFLAGLISHVNLGCDAFSGFNALAPLVLIALVVRRRENRALFVSFVVLTVMMLLPAFGSLMNGFQYPADRWSYAYDLCVAVAVVRLLPALKAFSPRAKRVTAVLLAVYGAAFILLPLSVPSKLFAAEFVLVAVVAALLFAPGALASRKVLAGVCACIAVSGSLSLAWYVSPYGDQWAYQLVGFNKNYAFHTSLETTSLVEQAKENGLYDETARYDRAYSESGFIQNSNLVTGNMGISFYNSIYADGVDAFNTSLGLVSTEGINFRYSSLDSRTVLDTVLGVRYFSVRDVDAGLLPMTYRGADAVADGNLREGKHYTLYETDRSLPLAFAYTGYIAADDYYALSQVDRQASLMQAVTLNAADADKAGVPDVSDALELTSYEIPFTVEAAKGCNIRDDGSFVARSSNATVTLWFESPADAEAYLCITGLRYEDMSLRKRYNDQDWEALGFINRNKTSLNDLLYTERESSSIIVRSQGTERYICIVGAADHMYSGKEDWSCNLGYSEDGLTSVQLSFANPGVYSFDSMSIQVQPMDGFDAQYEALAANAATDLQIGRNEISCSIDTDEDALLFFSVAYGQGWSAEVDGEPADILKADLGFMAVPVSAGPHEVRLTYRTPYLGVGLALTAAGLVGVVALLAVRRVRRRRSPEETVSAAVLPDATKHE